MPIATAAFAASKPLDPTRANRAYADVRIVDPAGDVSPIVDCLVDTGSDHTILPLFLAAALGIVPSGPMVAVRTAGGAMYSLRSDTVEIEIEGYRIIETVLFEPGAGFAPILGRMQLVNTFDIAFDTTHGYFG